MGSVYREGRYFVGDGPPPAVSLSRRIAADDPEYAFYAVAEVAAAEAPVTASAPVADADADADRRVGGWLELHRLQPRRMRHVAMLTVAVAPEWRRRGLGRALLRRGYVWASEVGVAKISLNVRAGNVAAIALYLDEGFVEEGRERDQVRTDDGSYEDNLILARWG